MNYRRKGGSSSTTISLHVYFFTEYNIFFQTSKKDRCDVAERNHDRSGIEKAVLCVDLENVLTCQRADVNKLFYKSKLSVYNLTAHLSLSKQVYCSAWSEHLMGRKGNDIVSALLMILSKVLTDHPHLTELTLWNDSHPSVQELDATHSTIERVLQKTEYYSHPSLIRILLKFLYRDYWTRPLTLSELTEDVENTNLDTDLIPDEIIIFPPDDGEVTDEDSGEEDNVVINNLPGAQLRTLAEVVLPNIEDVSDFDSEDDLPLSRFVKRQQVSRPKKKQTEELAWIKNDITPNMPSWTPPYGPKQEISPVESFYFLMTTS
nr:unnamed protein product [Callosobruchus chinensis]